MYYNSFLESLWTVLGIIIVVILLMSPIIICCYYSSCRQAELFNQQNGTEYTCADFFWASGQINQQTQTIKLQSNEIK